ncbi:hypothetical protein [Pseudomonas orientalis]|uniref:hypothetical protein n=1 Tax=Pseudomonas orientalis TaxID=76758 RepID=UPI000F56CFAD|nr:hypothetical protein [Pseudomonas orientalis]AZE88119.1 hypothetical protein C4J97_1402 [Pseudomonas orientalis]
MLEPNQRTPGPILRQVIGWVVVLPLLISMARLPFPMGLGLALGTIAASVYGVLFASRHASRRVTLFALVITLLNIVSLVLLSTASMLMALYFISRIYGYSYFSNWVYWNF